MAPFDGSGGPGLLVRGGFATEATRELCERFLGLRWITPTRRKPEAILRTASWTGPRDSEAGDEAALSLTAIPVTYGEMSQCLTQLHRIFRQRRCSRTCFGDHEAVRPRIVADLKPLELHEPATFRHIITVQDRRIHGSELDLTHES